MTAAAVYRELERAGDGAWRYFAPGTANPWRRAYGYTKREAARLIAAQLAQEEALEPRFGFGVNYGPCFGFGANGRPVIFVGAEESNRG